MPAHPGRQRDQAHQVVVQPHLLQREEPAGGVGAVLGDEQLLEPFGQAAHDRRRQHAGQLDEGVAGGRPRRPAGATWYGVAEQRRRPARRRPARRRAGRGRRPASAGRSDRCRPA